MENLSEAARTALINVGTNRQGAIVHPSTPAGTRHELADAGIIGAADGLTCKGSMIRAWIMEEALREAFGE